MALTYADATGAVRAWINGRTGLVGPGNPLAVGAHLKTLESPAPQTYAFLEEVLTTQTGDSAESPDMLATIGAQVYGGTREAASRAAIALAEELTALNGMPEQVDTHDGPVLIWVADDVQGPTWTPDGNLARYLVQFTVRVRPL